MYNLTPDQKLLYWAVRRHDIKQVRKLLEKGVNPNLRGTPPFDGMLLHHAVENRDTLIIDLLIKAGVDLNTTDSNGHTPMDIAESFGKVNVVSLALRRAGARTSAQLQGRAPAPISLRGINMKHFKPAAEKEKAKEKQQTSPPPVEEEEKKQEAPPPAPQPERDLPDNLPLFTVGTVPKIFAAEKWVNRTGEMQDMWQYVPEDIKKTFDFSTALTKARQLTLAEKPSKSITIKKKGDKNTP